MSDNAPASNARKRVAGLSPRGRWRKRLLVGLGLAAIVALGVTVTRLVPVSDRFYTDADTINVPAAIARTRDILWQPPRKLADVLNTTSDDYEPRLTADGLMLFFVRGKAGENADIYFSRRTHEGWTEPEPLVGVNSEYDDLGPEPSHDGQSLYFYSDRPDGSGGYDLWVAHRPPAADWQAPINLGPSVNSEFNDYGPALTPDGQTLYFSSNRPQPEDADEPDPNAWPATLREDLYQRDYDLYMAVITERGPGRAQPLATLNTPYNDGAPAVSSFGDFLYFASDRPGGEGGFDLYRSRRRVEQRPALLSHWRARNLGPTVNTTANELDPGLSLGGYGLYFSSDRPHGPSKLESPRQYDLYHTTSREVFTETKQREQPPINWAALWSQIGPNLLWALLALLLLLAFLALLRDARGRRLSLLAKCLLASLAAHLLLMLLFNVWEVTTSLANEFRRRGAIKVALASPTIGDGLANQIRGEFTEVETPTPPTIARERQAAPVEIQAAAAMAMFAVERRSVHPPEQSVAELMIKDIGIEHRREPPSPLEPMTSADVPLAFDPALPADQARIAAGEPDASSRIEAVNAKSLTRPTLAMAMSQPVGTVQQSTMPLPGNETTHAQSPDTSMADAPPLRDVDARPSVNAAVSESTPAMNPPTMPELPLPAAPEERAVAAVEPQEKIPDRIALAPRSHLPADRSLESAQRTFALMKPEAVGLTSVADSLAPSPDDHATDATLTGTSLEPNIATEAEPTLPALAELALPSVERSTAASKPESVLQASTTVLTLPRSPLTPGARVVQDSSAVRLRVPPVSQYEAEDPPNPLTESLLHEYIVERAGARFQSRTSDSVPLPADLTIPEAPEVSLNLPTEQRPPTNPYVQRQVPDRLAIVERMGGSEETERAVADALRWLANHQSSDGRWDGDGFDELCGTCGGETDVAVDRALTGLALLSFLGAGHTHVSDGPYQDAVELGLHWLLDRQTSDGDLRGDETMYTQGITTIALSEAYGMTGDAGLVEPVRLATRFIDRARNRSVGGWRYDPGQVGDTSVLGWQIMALKSASINGIAVPAEPFSAARKWLDLVSSSSRPGLYAYQPRRRYTPSMTAEGMFTQQLLGRNPNNPRMQASAEFVSQYPPDWESSPNTYYWYYATLALFQHKGEMWQVWNQRLTEQLLNHQRQDGQAAGSWDPVGEWANIGGRVYQTTLCTLMLEVYYRYLPLYSLEEVTDPIGTIRGLVTDATTGEPVAGATVRLDLLDRATVLATAGAGGDYVLATPEVPDFFALSASMDGYVPSTANVASAMVQGTTLTLDFQLQLETQKLVAIERTPDVHHLGDDNFDGRINSRFQKKSEGSSFTAQFELGPDQLPPHINKAQLRLLAKGVQRRHKIRINGTVLDERLDDSPSDGSFGEFSTPFDAALLKPGVNTFEIIAKPSSSDIDDFEFVNVRMRLSL